MELPQEASRGLLHLRHPVFHHRGSTAPASPPAILRIKDMPFKRAPIHRFATMKQIIQYPRQNVA
jgi:hypothetical protein